MYIRTSSTGVQRRSRFSRLDKFLWTLLLCEFPILYCNTDQSEYLICTFLTTALAALCFGWSAVQLFALMFFLDHFYPMFAFIVLFISDWLLLFRCIIWLIRSFFGFFWPEPSPPSPVFDHRFSRIRRGSRYIYVDHDGSQTHESARSRFSDNTDGGSFSRAYYSPYVQVNYRSGADNRY